MNLKMLARHLLVKIIFSYIFSSLIVIVFFFLFSDFHDYLGSLENGVFLQLIVFMSLFLMLALTLILSGRARISEQIQSNGEEFFGILSVDAKLVGLNFFEGFIKGFTRAQNSHKKG